MKFKNFIFLLMIILILSKMIAARGPHFGDPNPGDPGYWLETTFRADDCRPCHVPHGAKGESRLWPVGTPGTGVTVIQNLCMYCHQEIKTTDQVDDDSDGFPDARFAAHILNRAHGKHGASYHTFDTLNADTTERYGPGHLYRHSTPDALRADEGLGDTVHTRDYDTPIQGYGAFYGVYDNHGYNSMVVAADYSSTIQNFALFSRLSCFSCHNPHADYIASYTNRGGSTETYDSSYADNYIKNLVDDRDDSLYLKPTKYDSVRTDTTNSFIGRTRLVCLACHFGGEEPNRTGYYYLSDVDEPTIIDAVIPPIPPGKNQTIEGKKSVGAHFDGRSRCTKCHSWDWPPANCDQCHGFPPAGATGLDRHYPQDYNTLSYPALSIVGIGAHETHVSGQGYDCGVCHREYLDSTHNNETVEVLFDTGNIYTETTATSTTYVTVEVKFPGGTKLLLTDTCENSGIGEDKVIRCMVACHNPIPGGKRFDKLVYWPVKPVGERGNPPLSVSFVESDVYDSLTCVDCHDGLWNSANTGEFQDTSHHPFAPNSNTTKRAGCLVCHSSHGWIYYNSTGTRGWFSRYDSFGLYSDGKKHETHASLSSDPVVKQKIGGFDTFGIFEMNPMVFNSTSTPNFPNPALALYPRPTRDAFGFLSRFGTTGVFDIYNESTNRVGFCDPCHDSTPLEIRNGLITHADSTLPIIFDGYSYRAPKAAAFFYQETTFYGTTGSGGHGYSSTDVTGHLMGDSRLPEIDDGQRVKCRSCHFFHGSSNDKILDTVAMRPKDEGILFPYGNYFPYSSPAVAYRNNNAVCYRCHFYRYDNGFYCSTAFDSSSHGDTTDSSNFKIWSDTMYYDPYPTTGVPHPESYFWKTRSGDTTYQRGLCIYCHEPHGGYGWDTSVFDTWGFSSHTRAGTRGKYVDDSSYGAAVNLGDQKLCFKCHSADETWNVYREVIWSDSSFAGKVYNVVDWEARGDTTVLDISGYFDSISSHRVNIEEQKPGALGNPDYLIVECINCHNPHAVIKDIVEDSVATNLMHPYNTPDTFMSDSTVTDTSLVYRLYNKICLVCHNTNSESGGGYGINEQRGMFYKGKTDVLWGKLPRGISFSQKNKGGEGDTTSPDDTTHFHSFNKESYYSSTGHGLDSTLSIGYDSVDDIEPLARLGDYGMACARIGRFACHDPHGSGNISLVKADVRHPNGNNYGTPHIYDTTFGPADDAKNTDKWCAAACHRIGKRGEKDWNHTFNYVRENESPYGNSAGVFKTDYGFPESRDIDIYDTDMVGAEPILDNVADRDQDYATASHSSYNRVPGDGNEWPDVSAYGYDTNYKLYLPAKTDGWSANRFVCFTCHDPHGSKNQGMIRYPSGFSGSDLCLKCHTP